MLMNSNTAKEMTFTIKTLVPQMRNVYSSFPTVTEHEGTLFVFYRQGIKSDTQCHGLHGSVRCFEINKDLFLHQFDAEGESLYDYGRDYSVFEGENEIDAIVSKLDDNRYSLCTRNYMKGEPMKTYISISDTPRFSERHEVKVEGTEWVVFYGKAFQWKEGYVFPAYGNLNGNRTLMLYSEDFESWDLLSYIPDHIKGMILNESSVVFDGEHYIVFMREDTEPFGIWYALSRDPASWSVPEKIVSSAQAPMAVRSNGKIYLTFREIISDDQAFLSLMTPLDGKGKIALDGYGGNPYDGGYSDMVVIDGRVFVVYYCGNEEGEPYLKCCEVRNDETLTEHK